MHQQYDKRGVLLLRNPMDVVFTYRDWLHGGKVGKAPPEAFRGPEWDATVDYVAYAWADHAIRWIEQIENGTVLFYERLMGQTASGELKRFLQVIDFHPVDPVRMRCTLDHRNRTDHKRLNKTRWENISKLTTSKSFCSFYECLEMNTESCWNLSTG